MKKLFPFVFAFFLVPNFCFSQVSGASALIMLEEIDAKISKHIQSLDNLKTNAIGDGGNMLLSISARLKKDINETVGNTDKMLREHELATYNLLLSLFDEFQRNIEDDLHKIDNTTTRITQTVADLLIDQKEPIILDFDTQTFIRNHSARYTLKLSGSNFDRSEQIYIAINGKKIEPIQSTYKELIFHIDSADIKPLTTTSFTTTSHIVFRYKEGWIFKKNRIKDQPFIIPITPLNIGSAVAYYEQERPVIKYSDPISYSCSCSTGASDYKGDKKKSSTSFNVLPTDGRMIDPESVKVKKWNQRHGGGKSFDHVTEQQIKGKITCNSDAKPFGGGGHSTITFTYREYEVVYEPTQDQTESLKVTSVNPVIFNLPDPINDKRPNLKYISINTYDGRELHLVPTVSNPYFSLSINPVTDDVILAWKED